MPIVSAKKTNKNEKKYATEIMLREDFPVPLVAVVGVAEAAFSLSAYSLYERYWLAGITGTVAFVTLLFLLVRTLRFYNVVFMAHAAAFVLFALSVLLYLVSLYDCCFYGMDNRLLVSGVVPGALSYLFNSLMEMRVMNKWNQRYLLTSHTNMRSSFKYESV